MNFARWLPIAAWSFALIAPASARDLTTVTGDIFRGIAVTKVEATGVQLTHADGVAFVDFRDLGEAERKEFGFDAARYAAGLKEKAEAEKARRTQALAAQQSAAARARTPETAPRDLAPRTWTPANATGLEVTIDSPGFRYGPYWIEGRGFSNTIPPSLGGNLVPSPYFPYDGRNGAYWGPTIIRRR